LAGDSQQALLKVVDDAAGTQSQQAAFDEAKRAFLVARAQMRELEGKLQGREPLSLALQDIQRKLARFEGADHAAVLKNYQRTSRQNRELERQFEAAAELSTLESVCRRSVGGRLAGRLVRYRRRRPGTEHCQALHAAIAKAQRDVENAANVLQERGQVLRERTGPRPGLRGSTRPRGL
jgi:hypothetical protein